MPPTTINWRLALVIDTILKNYSNISKIDSITLTTLQYLPLRRLMHHAYQKAKTSPTGLERTKDRKMASFSLPWTIHLLQCRYHQLQKLP
jgi:hypothetical protein